MGSSFNRNALRVLVVDDNEFSAQTLTWAMEIFGYEVRTCFSGSTAITVAREFKPQIVLLDIGMPLMNGYEVCRILRADASTSSAYLFAQTGWGMPIRSVVQQRLVLITISRNLSTYQLFMI